MQQAFCAMGIHWLTKQVMLFLWKFGDRRKRERWEVLWGELRKVGQSGEWQPSWHLNGNRSQGEASWQKEKAVQELKGGNHLGVLEKLEGDQRAGMWGVRGSGTSNSKGTPAGLLVLRRASGCFQWKQDDTHTCNMDTSFQNQEAFGKSQLQISVGSVGFNSWDEAKSMCSVMVD